MIRIIDNKKIELTEDEWKVYQEICKAYDRPRLDGKDLFKNLFETDDEGYIIFLRPPSKTYSSLEIVLFLQNVMVHQHLRKMYHEHNIVMQAAKDIIVRAENVLSELKNPSQ